MNTIADRVAKRTGYDYQSLGALCLALDDTPDWVRLALTADLPFMYIFLDGSSIIEGRDYWMVGDESDFADH